MSDPIVFEEMGEAVSFLLDDISSRRYTATKMLLYAHHSGSWKVSRMNHREVFMCFSEHYYYQSALPPGGLVVVVSV